MLGRIANDREQYESDKYTRDAGRGDKMVDGRDKTLGAQRNEDGASSEQSQRRPQGQLGFLDLLLLRHLGNTGSGDSGLADGSGAANKCLSRLLAWAANRSFLGRCIVEHTVRFELEAKIRCVDQEQDDRGASRELSDTDVTSTGGEVECSRDDEAADGERKEGGCGLRHRSIEVLLDAIEAAGDEGHAEDEEAGGGEVNADKRQ